MPINLVDYKKPFKGFRESSNVITHYGKSAKVTYPLQLFLCKPIIRFHTSNYITSHHIAISDLPSFHASISPIYKNKSKSL